LFKQKFKLDCVDTITDEGLKNLTQLQGLDLGHSRNPITEKGISHLTNLWYLNLWKNENISKTIVQKLPNITHIWCEYGLITEQDLIDMGRNDIIKNSQSRWTKEKESRFTNFLVIEDDD
jgi:Leucine-rich repeat (LRR) protein